jgi:hypothetical protein
VASWGSSGTHGAPRQGGGRWLEPRIAHSREPAHQRALGAYGRGEGSNAAVSPPRHCGSARVAARPTPRRRPPQWRWSPTAATPRRTTVRMKLRRASLSARRSRESASRSRSAMYSTRAPERGQALKLSAEDLDSCLFTCRLRPLRVGVRSRKERPSAEAAQRGAASVFWPAFADCAPSI